MPYAFFYTRVCPRHPVLNEEAIAKYHQLLKSGCKTGGRYRDARDMATKPLVERRAGKKLFAVVHYQDHLVIEEASVCFANRRDMVVQLKVWHERGIVLHVYSPSLSLHTDTEEGRAMLRGMIALESVTWKMNKKPNKVWHTGRLKSFGYRRIRYSDGRKSRLVPHPQERAFMLKVYELHKAGLGFHNMERLLRRKGFVNPRTGAAIRADFLEKVYKQFLNRVEIGEMQLPEQGAEK